jgi:DNA processing protein
MAKLHNHGNLSGTSYILFHFEQVDDIGGKEMDNYYAAALQSVSGIGSAKIAAMIDYFGSAQQAWQAQKGDLFLCKILDGVTCNNLVVWREQLDVEKLRNDWDRKKIHLCSKRDQAYPVLLKNVYEAPYLLYYRGSLPAHSSLMALVGARRASAYGKNVAHMLAAQLAEAGYWVVSGAARGIDTASHVGALTRGATIAILGCGVDICYPRENERLLQQICEQGAVVSEYMPGTPPHPGFFPARNRIISGMARGVVVIEAAERSGALITADRALEEGRDVYAVPGSIFSKTSVGTHRLIQQGAKLVQGLKDILQEYEFTLPHREKQEQLDADEQQIYHLLSYDTPVMLEELAIKTSLTLSSITYIILQLELRGLVVQHGSQSYVRTTKEGIE